MIMSSRNTMNIIFTTVKNIKFPINLFIKKSNNKSMLGRWGSVRDTNSSLKYTYGYDCAKEFNNKTYSPR